MNDLEFLFWKNFNSKILSGNQTVYSSSQNLIFITPTSGKFALFLKAGYILSGIQGVSSVSYDIGMTTYASYYYILFSTGNGQIQTERQEFDNRDATYQVVNGTNRFEFNIYSPVSIYPQATFQYFSIILFD